MDALAKIVGLVVLGTLIVFALSLFFSVPVWLLWNYCLVGAVDGIHEVTWLQAWGIGALCGMLFKSTTTNKKD